MSDLLELFSRDPLTFTKEGGEIRDMISQFREKRSAFNLGNLAAGRTKAAAGTVKESAAAAAVKASGLSLNLGGLLKKKVTDS